jgi:ABC-2 type transport system permease protein
MSWTLFWKLLRDIRWSLFFVGLLICVYELLWARITQRVLELTPKLLGLFGSFQAMKAFEDDVLKGPGELIRSMLGGEMIRIDNPQSILSVGYIHPFIITVFCIWAIGRASGAIAGEIDRGTMELLLAQPIARWKVITTHLVIDLVTIPVLLLCMILGTTVGVNWLGLPDVRLAAFLGALVNAAALMFAVSGYTMFLSAIGRYRWRVLGLALGLTLVQFLINILGEFWTPLTVLRPLTVFYYYRPQPIILNLPGNWTVPIGKGIAGSGGWFDVNVVMVLVLVGVIGYALAIWRFSRRDLPAPL